MMRERFVFINKEEESKLKIKHDLEEGKLTKEKFDQLSSEDQEIAKDLLFELASEKVNVFHSLSVLEFMIIASMRLQLKEDELTGLTEDDIKIKEAMKEFVEAHELGDTSKPISEWTIDYLAYIKKQTALVIKNRGDHIERKRSLTE